MLLRGKGMLLRTYRRGLLWGFVFGTFGLWVLALLALALQPVEILTNILFVPGRWFASVLAPSGSGSTLVSVAGMLFNGVLYALLGALLQVGLRRAQK